MNRLGRVASLSLALSLSAVPAGAQTARAKPPKQAVRTFHMDAENWRFVPDSITVHQGDKVVLEVVGADASHRFDLKAYDLKVPLPQGQTTTIEFVADKPGKHVWRCGRPCGDGCPKMTGTLIVLEDPPPASGTDRP